jgi:hypothetical protein
MKLWPLENVMIRVSLPTRYACLTRRESCTVLVLIAVALVAAVLVTFSPMANSNPDLIRTGPGDVDLYMAEVTRIRGGESYYQAAAAELTARGYPTRSVFNWRTPLPIWLLGKLPTAGMGKALLGGLAVVLLVVAVEALVREENKALCRPAGCALLLIGAVQPTIADDMFVVPVLWAGVFLALSACCYGVNRPVFGVVFGLTAVFFRELALPYCVLSTAIAWRRGRWGELAGWLFGLTAWLAFFALHWWTVSGLIAPNALAHRHGWIQFGGVGFVISMVQMNTYLVSLPQWVAAIYLVAAIVGLGGWGTPLGMRITAATCLYLMAFAVVGQSFNQCWGVLISPLLCFGAVRFPASLLDLCKAAKSVPRSGGLV